MLVHSPSDADADERRYRRRSNTVPAYVAVLFQLLSVSVWFGALERSGGHRVVAVITAIACSTYAFLLAWQRDIVSGKVLTWSLRTLVARSRLNGIVTAGGKPAGGVTVVAYPVYEESLGEPRAISSLTEASGRFSIKSRMLDPPQMTYQIRVLAPDGAESWYRGGQHDSGTRGVVRSPADGIEVRL